MSIVIGILIGLCVGVVIGYMLCAVLCFKDKVSVEACLQIAKERDLAIEQLRSCGVEFGAKTEAEENKELTTLYPFLLPRNVFTDELPEDYDYSWIRLDEVEKGWRELFLEMCEEIRDALIDANYLDEFRFSQIKEKWGSLRVYHFGAPQEVVDIIRKYEKLSAKTCVQCGKPAVKRTVGYILPYCTDCADKAAQYEDLVDIEVN